MTDDVLFSNPKPGDAICIPSRYHGPIKRLIAKVAPTRFTDDAGITYRRLDGRQVGKGRDRVVPWTAAHDDEAANIRTVNELRAAVEHLDRVAREGVKRSKMDDARALIASIYRFAPR